MQCQSYNIIHASLYSIPYPISACAQVVVKTCGCALVAVGAGTRVPRGAAGDPGKGAVTGAAAMNICTGVGLGAGVGAATAGTGTGADFGAFGSTNRGGTPLAAYVPCPTYAPTSLLHLYSPFFSFWISL